MCLDVFPLLVLQTDVVRQPMLRVLTSLFLFPSSLLTSSRPLRHPLPSAFSPSLLCLHSVQRDLCSASDVLGGERPHDVLRTVSSLLLQCASGEAARPAGAAATCPPFLQLLYQYHGFLLFYTLLMLMLYVAYSKMCPS